MKMKSLASMDNNDLSSEVSSSWSIPSHSSATSSPVSAVTRIPPVPTIAANTSASALTRAQPSSRLTRAQSLTSLSRISSTSTLVPTTVPPAPLTNPFISTLTNSVSLSPTIISPKRATANWRDVNAKPNQKSGKYVVYVEKIHWITTKHELLKLFWGINILNGIKGIHFVVLNKPCVANNAFIELSTEDDYQRMLAFKPTFVSGNYQTGRFIAGIWQNFAFFFITWAS